MKKKKQQIDESNIFDIDHKEIARHFGMTVTNMLTAKKRYLEGKKSIWPLYCKAYQWDKLKEKMGA